MRLELPVPHVIVTFRGDGKTRYPYPGPAHHFPGWAVQCPSCNRWGVTNTGRDTRWEGGPIIRWQEGRFSEAWRCSKKSQNDALYECACGAVWRRDEGRYP